MRTYKKQDATVVISINLSHVFLLEPASNICPHFIVFMPPFA